MMDSLSDASRMFSKKVGGTEIIKCGWYHLVRTSEKDYAVTFTRAPFYKLGKFFPEWEGYLGETLELDMMNRLPLGIEVVIVSNNYIKMITVDEMKKRGKIRQMFAGKIAYHLPLDFMRDYGQRVIEPENGLLKFF